MKSRMEDMEDDEFSGNAASGYKAASFNGVAFGNPGRIQGAPTVVRKAVSADAQNVAGKGPCKKEPVRQV
jgi:hypothetical protein